MRQKQDPDLVSRALELFSAQQKMLRQAGVSQDLLDVCTSIIRYVSNLGPEQRNQFARSKSPPKKQSPSTNLSLEQARELTLEEVESILDEHVSDRKTLEVVAIGRFDVPKGSMRSFSNISMLREKVETLVQSERAHQTIGQVARQSGR